MTNFIHTIRDTDKVKRDFWKRVQSQRDRFESRFHNRFRNLISDQFKKLSNEITSDNLGSDLLIKKYITKEPIQKGYTELYVTVGSHFAKQSYEGLKFQQMGLYIKADKITEDEWEERMQQYSRTKVGERIVSVTAVSQSQAAAIVKKVIAKSFEEGWGADETARVIKAELTAEGEKLAYWRALRIARTEVATASNIGSIEGARALGYPMQKYWIATYDQRTRDTHKVVEQQNPIDLDDKFYVGSWRMDVPLDPNAGPEEVINCRCTVGFQVKGF